MAKLTKRELYMIYGLGMAYPIYPAILLDETRNGHISILRVSIIAFANAWLLYYLFAKAINLKINFDIDQYLSSSYSEDEQKRIVINYKRYKSAFFVNTPLFTLESLRRDKNLRRYLIEAFRAIFKLWAGGLCYLAALLFLFYFVIWDSIIAISF